MSMPLKTNCLLSAAEMRSMVSAVLGSWIMLADLQTKLCLQQALEVLIVNTGRD